MFSCRVFEYGLKRVPLGQKASLDAEKRTYEARRATFSTLVIYYDLVLKLFSGGPREWYAEESIVEP